MALSPLHAMLGLSTLLLPLAWPQAAAVSYPEARHLLARTGFGATPAEIERLGAVDYDVAVRRLLNDTRTQPLTPAPTWVDAPPPDPRRVRTMSETERKAFQRARREDAIDLKGWWYAEMIGTDSPHLLMGGRIKGGFYGAQPALTDLADGDLKHQLDYRSLYATVAKEWWGLSGRFSNRDYPALNCIA